MFSITYYTLLRLHFVQVNETYIMRIIPVFNSLIIIQNKVIHRKILDCIKKSQIGHVFIKVIHNLENKSLDSFK